MRVLALALPILAALAMPALAQTTAPGAAPSGGAMPTAAPSNAQMAQRQRMTACNTDAGARKLAGETRKTFMADCLAGKSAAAPAEKPMTAQQMKMKTCNTDASAKSLKGKDRQAFMSTCLKS